MTMQEPIIEINHAALTFHGVCQAVDVFRDLNLSLAAGGYYAVTGRSGSGKSSLLNLIAGYLKPSSGQICVCGKEVSALNEKQMAAYRCRDIGVIFQAFHLIYAYTAMENVMLPALIAGVPARQAQEKAESLLQRLGMEEQMKSFPGTMSGGQQQRTAIARALMMDPPLLLADEPTGSLDSESADMVMRELADVHAQGKTILLITHDQPIALQAEKILRMEEILGSE